MPSVDKLYSLQHSPPSGRPQRAEHASLPGHTAVLATEPLQLRTPCYGTVFHRT